MKKILIDFAHPAKSRSIINNALRKAVEDLDGVTVNDLYSIFINVADGDRCMIMGDYE